MDIKTNRTCDSKIELCDTHITIEDIISLKRTKHSYYRNSRWAIALLVNMDAKRNLAQAPIIKVFKVDRGHIAGPELHAITANGIIFVLNEIKYANNEDALITVLIARCHQIQILYNSCQLTPPQKLMSIAHANQKSRFYNC